MGNILKQQNDHVCTLAAVGDIMLHGKIAEMINKTSDPGFPFRKIQHLLKDKDILFGNLETMISKQIQPSPGTPGKYFSLPGTGRMLREMGFDIVNIGHNHLYDWGAEGVELTFKELSEEGIKYGGAVKSKNGEWGPVIVNCPECGKRFGFLFYTSTYNTLDKKNIYMGREPSSKNMRKDLFTIKPEVDIAVVSIHGGACLNYWPSPEMLEYCRQATEFGADIVLGHHPHVINGIERFNNSIIAYALPDSIRPLPLDEDEVYESMKKERYESFILKVLISGNNSLNYSISPCVLDNSLQTRPADADESKNIIGMVDNLSGDIKEGESTKKHFQTIQKDFKSIYFDSLLRAFKKGGLKWLWCRLRTLRPYHLLISFHAMFGRLSRR
jgi:poly-gamma-glutamate synthesis protein (capsule biosynthesis protein)